MIEPTAYIHAGDDALAVLGMPDVATLYLDRCQVDTPQRLVQEVWTLVNERRPQAGVVVDFGAGDARFARHGRYQSYLGYEIDRTRCSTIALPATHRVVNYLSALTGRVLPMRFENNGHRLEISARHVVGINESNAHFAAGLAGLGVIQTFAFIARDALIRGDLVEVLPRWRPKPYPLHLVYPPNRHLSQRLRVFIDWMAERFETQLEQGKG